MESKEVEEAINFTHFIIKFKIPVNWFKFVFTENANLCGKVVSELQKFDARKWSLVLQKFDARKWSLVFEDRWSLNAG